VKELVPVSTLENICFLLILGSVVLAGCLDSSRPAGPNNDAPAEAFVVAATVPALISKKDPYPLFGSASHPATGWTWERSHNGGPYQFWASAQNTRFVAYAGEHHLEWRLTARRVADGVAGADIQTTVVCIGSGCAASGLPPPATR
jgi:hypothetical protein